MGKRGGEIVLGWKMLTNLACGPGTGLVHGLVDSGRNRCHFQDHEQILKIKSRNTET